MRRALVVGINAYSWGPLHGAVPDAERIQRLLAKHEDGSPNFSVRTLLGTEGAPVVTKQRLKAEAIALFKQKADVALFYYAGHGGPTATGGYLNTPDAQPYDEGFAMADLLRLATDSPVAEVIILLDCCHSGLLGEASAATKEITVLRDGICVILASRASEAAGETPDGGVFTQLVCDALDGAAADVLGRVTAASVYAYVDQLLSAWNQRPLFRASLSKFHELRKVEPAVKPEIIRRLPEFFPTPDYVYPLNKSYEPSVEPADEKNEAIFKIFQTLRDAKLLAPHGAEHLYYAAITEASCNLTPLGKFYWQLADANLV